MTSVVAFAAGKVVSAVSTVSAFYSEVNPATLSGAIDVVVVQHPDGELVCSPFHVRFGKLKLLRPHDKAVEVSINGRPTDLLMKVGEAGEAFFVVETDNPVPSEYATSPIQQPLKHEVNVEPLDLNATTIPETAAANGEPITPTANGYVSAHGSDIGEDEYPVTDASQGATAGSIENRQNGDRLNTSEAHAKPASSKASAKGSELPIDADDTGDQLHPQQNALLNGATSDSNTDTSRHLRRSSKSSGKTKGSDRPIDAEDVTQSFAADAHLVGMVQGENDKDPNQDGVVETAPSVVDESDPVGASLGSESKQVDIERSTTVHIRTIDEINLDGSIFTSQVVSVEAEETQKPTKAEQPAETPASLAQASPQTAAALPEILVESHAPSALPTPSSVLTDDPMVKTAKNVNAALGSHVPVVPLHAHVLSTSKLSKPPVPQVELEKPKLPHSKSLPFAADSGELKRGGHSRASSMQMIQEVSADNGTTVIVTENEEGTQMPGGYIKRANTGPLSDTEVEYKDYEAEKKEQRRRGWSWRWGGLPKKNADDKADDAETPLRRDRTKSAEPLSSMSVDEKVNSYLAGLPNRSFSPDRAGSPELVSEPAQSPEPAAVPHESDLANGPEVPLSFAFNADVDMEMSLCGYDKMRSVQPEEGEELFQKNLITFESFCKNPELLMDPNLVFRINGNYYSWAMAGPMLMANIAFKKPLPEDLVQRLAQQQGPGQATADNRRYSFNQLKSWWSRSSSSKITNIDPEGKVKVETDVKLERKEKATVPQEPPKQPESPVQEQKFPAKFAKSLRLTSEQLKHLNLNKGANTITFSVNQGGASVSAKLFLYDYTCKIVISDIDGTITKSDALGHIFTMVGKDWTHLGIASLYTNIRKNGYHILYLTSRAIGQAGSTREYLAKVEQGGYQLPEGPVIMSPDRLFASFHREVILRKPEEFKMACLRDIKRLFGDRTPFYAGFGNRITDALSYRSVDVPSSRIFTIDPAGDVKLELLAEYKSSYVKLNDIVDQIFPPINGGGLVTPEFNDWNYWKSDLPHIELPGEASTDAEMEAKQEEEVDEELDDEYEDSDDVSEFYEEDEEEEADTGGSTADAAKLADAMPVSDNAADTAVKALEEQVEEEEDPGAWRG
ncbi:phosphatidate phosphatase PAH1 [Spizellomyces punctatus DAOM BR117]|uniref:phosphatidate phosphatase n=1 Tax=Spizellomyces punctatus (strain DAOM BR117) TaxID=645134 RepID=A0A0L0HN55_SPIPD|nr:phosphatidate phosphatase PAH1 [Spizellomyces punctatus DAOM BR117]KND02493.1 hypothetical protein SPPG_02952 [Spizellomyces punctatus DAOM BR117]|eukprot:XP_016610532.1 hypothetical protein SPPG_02952 [Spizellomyces punctatus DAOM BR117]